MTHPDRSRPVALDTIHRMDDPTRGQRRFLLVIGGIVALLLVAGCLGCTPVPGLLVYFG